MLAFFIRINLGANYRRHGFFSWVVIYLMWETGPKSVSHDFEKINYLGSVGIDLASLGWK